MNQQNHKAGFFQLVPFILFVVVFFISTLFLHSRISPVFACLLGIALALFTFPKETKLNRKMEVFVEGCSRPAVVSMLFIFIFASIFTYVLNKIGSVEVAVNCGLMILPKHFILPGFFLLVGAFAVAVGSSMGTIAALLPIGMGLTQVMDISPAFMAGLVVSGAMLGDNLSIISDTTIAAVQSTGCSMKKKFLANLYLVIPAMIASLVILFFINQKVLPEADVLSISTVAKDYYEDCYKILPYGFVLLLAVIGLDVIVVLVLGILMSIGIGIYDGVFEWIGATNLFVEGFTQDSDIHEVLILSLFVAGLARIAEYTGGIQFLLDRLSTRVKGSKGAELVIAGVMFLVNAAVAINTIAILIMGPVAKRVGDKFNIERERVACLLDIFACICQGVIPYAPQLLLAASIAGVSSTSIIPHLHYQGLILLVALLSILLQNKIKFSK